MEDRLTCWRLTLAWNGAAYVGWQRQSGGRSLQEVVEDAVSRAFGGEEVRVTASGRTDAGVHALAQVLAFRARATRQPGELLNALNHGLPRDICALDVAVVPDHFDVRRWVLRKLYRYRVLNRHVRCPFREGIALHWRARLDVAAMDAAAQALVGRHDFTSFRARGCGALHPVRKIEEAAVRAVDDEVWLEFTGNGFLRHQVRIMSGTLMEVGQGRFPPEHVGEVLEARQREQAGRTLPAHGLWLVRVELGDGPRVPSEQPTEAQRDELSEEEE